MSTVPLKKNPDVEVATGMMATDVLLHAAEDGQAQLLILNPSGFTQQVEKYIILGEATEVNVVKPFEEKDPR